MAAPDLMAPIARDIGTWPPRPPADECEFALLAAMVQKLDRWHRALAPGAVRDRSQDHEAVLDRMAIDSRYNADALYGLVIPAMAVDDANAVPIGDLDWSTSPSSYAILSALLHYTAYLPPKLVAGAPDSKVDANGTASATCEVAFRYYRSPLGDPAPLGKAEDLVLGVAPCLEAVNDAKFWQRMGRYSVHPAYSEARLLQLVAQACADDVHILFLPEMAIDEDNLDHLKQAVRSTRREFARTKGRTPNLHYVMTGVLKRLSPDGPHQNYIILLGPDGSELFTQYKLTHWNLYAAAQSRFGLTDPTYPDPLIEDVEPGGEIVIADVKGLGRLLTLICADMSHNMPGDCILGNVGADWLYAPIMDASTCWTQGANWIVTRAARAAERDGTNVVVTNSIVMTHWNNDANEEVARLSGTRRYPPYEHCGIGLFLKRGPSGRIEMQHITVPTTGYASPILESRMWRGPWAIIPS